MRLAVAGAAAFSVPGSAADLTVAGTPVSADAMVAAEVSHLIPPAEADRPDGWAALRLEEDGEDNGWTFQCRGRRTRDICMAG